MQQRITSERKDAKVQIMTVDVSGVRGMAEATKKLTASEIKIGHVVANAGIVRMDSLLRPDPEGAYLS